jgi:predicted  nucleic acid-binding Zn-ribbon protein
MENELDLLVKIQGFDYEAKEAKARLTQIPEEITRLETEIKTKEDDLEHSETRIQELKKTYKLKELEIADNEGKINKLNTQTFAVKTNEEYRAILNEVEFLKKSNSEVEDEMLTILEEEEKIENSIDKSRTESKEYVDTKKAKIDDLRNECESMQEKQKTAEVRLEDNLAKLPDDLKELYGRIARVRGTAVCMITDNTCTGCYANLTHQFLNELKKRNKILICGNCGRILVYTEPNR